MLDPVRAALARLSPLLHGKAARSASRRGDGRARDGDEHLPIDASLMPLDLAGTRLPRRLEPAAPHEEWSRAA